MKLRVLCEDVSPEWVESSEALAALAEYLTEQGFYIESLRPFRRAARRRGHFLSIYTSPQSAESKTYRMRVLVSKFEEADWVRGEVL